MVYRRGGKGPYWLAVPTRTGWVKRSTGTPKETTAEAIEEMVKALGPRGGDTADLELIDAIADGKLSLARLYIVWRQTRVRPDAIQQLKAELRGPAPEPDVPPNPDLEPEIARWARWLRDHVRPDTIEHYVAHVRTLIPAASPHRVSAFTAVAIARWLADRPTLVQKRRKSKHEKSRRKQDPTPRLASAATKRKYLAAVRSFGAYLVEMGIVPVNPVRDVKAPRVPKRPPLELTLRDVVRIVEGARAPYQALFALLYGAGVEVSAALTCTEADVDAARREVRARGTKAETRDRVVRVAEWAWPYLATHLATLTPAERLFRLESEKLDRWKVGDEHRTVLRALGLPHHRVHDSRHFYAIRAVRAGTPYELVARQLGHGSVQMVAKTYAVFAPRSDERDRWEKIAAAMDDLPASSGTGVGTVSGTSEAAPNNDEVANAWGASNFENSRGGTRTRDPGIMSAVL
jgi:integrase